MLHNFYQPAVILTTFPAIAYTAITYGSLLAWWSILASAEATYLFNPPYNFTAAGVGLMNIAPFIGIIPAILVGGYLNDKSILWLSRRNGGIYEPEMRLWLALPVAITTPAGILMFGVGLSFVRENYSLHILLVLWMLSSANNPCFLGGTLAAARSRFRNFRFRPCCRRRHSSFICYGLLSRCE